MRLVLIASALLPANRDFTPVVCSHILARLNVDDDLADNADKPDTNEGTTC
jgi:hypothetical protein